jgi:hypothetical protein
MLLAPAWLGTGLLLPLVAGAVVMVLGAGLGGGADGDGGDAGTAFGGIQPWVFVLVYSGFTGQGLALAVALGSHARARGGRLLGARTGEVLAGSPPGHSPTASSSVESPSSPC